MSHVQHHHHRDKSESTEGTELWSMRSVSVRCSAAAHCDVQPICNVAELTLRHTEEAMSSYYQCILPCGGAETQQAVPV